uniref:Uncharacterized protein n=1 Tax=Trichinella nativa TaxID=6335 RepID=A0A0V1KGM3_9BILA
MAQCLRALTVPSEDTGDLTTSTFIASMVFKGGSFCNLLSS